MHAIGWWFCWYWRTMCFGFDVYIVFWFFDDVIRELPNLLFCHGIINFLPNIMVHGGFSLLNFWYFLWLDIIVWEICSCFSMTENSSLHKLCSCFYESTKLNDAQNRAITHCCKFSTEPGELSFVGKISALILFSVKVMTCRKIFWSWCPISKVER